VRAGLNCGAHAGTTGPNNYHVELVLMNRY
jgi:hypothetical protein